MFLKPLNSRLKGKLSYRVFSGDISLSTTPIIGSIRETPFHGSLLVNTTSIKGTLKLVNVTSPYLYVNPEYIFLTEYNSYQSDVEVYSNITWNI